MLIKGDIFIGCLVLIQYFLAKRSRYILITSWYVSGRNVVIPTSNKRQKFFCKFCGKIFSAKTSMNNQLATSFVFSAVKKALTQFLTWKDINTSYTWTNGLIRVWYATNTSLAGETLMNIWASLMVTEKKNKCENCCKEYAYKRSIERHVAVCGRQKPQVICEQCNKKFRSKRPLSNHMRVKHTNHKFVCELCG